MNPANKLLRQGFSIQELTAGLTCESDEEEQDEFQDEYQAEQEDDDMATLRQYLNACGRSQSSAAKVQVQQDDNSLFDKDADQRDQEWMQRHFKSCADQIQLCCSGCFTPVTYDALHISGHLWQALRVVNCLVVAETQHVLCDFCRNQVGTRRDQQVFEFSGVLPSTNRAKLL